MPNKSSVAASLLLAISAGLLLSAPGTAHAGTTAPTCIAPGQCFVTRNYWSGPVPNNLYTAHAGGTLFGIAPSRVSACRVLSNVLRNNGRIAQQERNCLPALRAGNPFVIFALDRHGVNNTMLFRATCNNPTRLRTRLTLVIDGRQYSGAVAEAVVRPCSST
ncbi:hypothetical protein E2F46_03260 [Luteimonas aestuarii]|uniref:Uncharacterized protein n=1 Tax=Luteimonas aestuarii TaxID=453837 RepID=A0A4R5U0X8_9GAMM|nr:hypothetical protein [Luteimonas aestuarii]TDK27235.1 hypothetical protein E2F46_03260 [Luteimonas aestuarii]